MKIQNNINKNYMLESFKWNEQSQQDAHTDLLLSILSRLQALELLVMSDFAVRHNKPVKEVISKNEDIVVNLRKDLYKHLYEEYARVDPTDIGLPPDE